MSCLRGAFALASVALLAVHVLAQSPPAAGAGPSCTISGLISSGSTPLPGVVVTATPPDGAATVSSSGPDGSYLLEIPGPGHYAVRGELTAFAPISRDVDVSAADCHPQVALELTLASRARPAPPPGAGTSTADAGAGSVDPSTAREAATRGRRPPGSGQGRDDGPGSQGLRGRAGAAGQQPFRRLSLVPDQLEAAGQDAATGSETELASALLPPGFSVDLSGDSVTAVGRTQSSESVFDRGGPGPGFPGGPGGLGGPGFVGFGGDGGPGGGGGPFGGPGRGGGPSFGGDGPAGFGGRGGPFVGRGRRPQIRGTVFQSLDTSHFDAAPYALNGQPTPKPDYLQQRFGATLGGPLVIPKLLDAGSRTFFYLNYTGNHSRNPYDVYSTVPTLAERTGDLSAIGRTVTDPATGLPFPSNQIPADRLDQSAQALLSLVPMPNQSGDRQNFHTVTTTSSQLDDINVRLAHSFGAPPPQGQGGRGGGGGGRGGFAGGRGGAASGRSNLNITVHFRHSDDTNQNPFPTLGGATTATAWDVPVGYSFSRWGALQSIRFQINRQRSATTNLYAFNQDIASQAGLGGVSSDPFDWGAPTLSFSTFSSLRDVTPATRTNQTLIIGDTITKTHGQHTVRAGGDYRDLRADSRTDANARGSFVFTGLYTGVDLADFLVGLPQQASVQFGPGLERFRSHSWDLFVQDDWRPRATLTVNAGLRYEYYAPYSEADNRLVNLDAAPGFTAVAPVAAGGTGAFSGPFPDTLVRPDRAGLAPRIGVAWKPRPTTTVRAGYGINYDASLYQTIAQQLAGQPPFAVAATQIGTAAAPLPLATALANLPANQTTNTFAVDPDYRLGQVQIWNVDFQRELTRAVNIGVGYTGTKGSNLDLLRAPNRGASGLLYPDVPPFIWESSEGSSILNSINFRIRRRMTRGLGASAAYTLSKSIDNASSIGGGTAVVAQDDRDLAAERGLSSFDQRHRFSGDLTYELPFGATKRWLQTGRGAELLGNWQVNATATFASGTPMTARVLGAFGDVAGGVNGTLRADYTGEPISIADPTVGRFFNTAAFAVPAPGTFGNAGRNTIAGPGTSSFNLGLSKTVTLRQSRTLSIQLLASNVFNTVQFAAIDTIVNSPTFGQVLAVRPMRRVQVVMRLRI